MRARSGSAARLARIAGLTVMLAAGAAPGAAQDRRTVVEPTIPPACTTLDAMLVPVGDSTIAEGDERRLDTERVQRAIDRCGAGHAVVLAPRGERRAFLLGPVTLRSGVTLVVAEGAIVFASRDPRLYDLTPGSCGVVSRKGHGCRPLIGADRARGAGVMGPGRIDGRGWAPLLGTGTSWWQLAEQARASYALSQNCPRLIHVTRSDDFTLYRLTLTNAPNFHVVFERGNGFTAWGVVIRTPRHARNTDGIDPISATNVTITHSFIATGDDNVAIKAGRLGPSTHITVAHNHFYSGHGMSIGSETNGGVEAVRVSDLSIDGADNGLRIKSNASRGGLVRDVSYDDVCIRRTKHPILLDTHYSASAETTGTLVPVFREVTLSNVRVLDGGTVTLDGHDPAHRLAVVMDNVVFDDPSAIELESAHVDVRRGPGPFELSLTGEDVHVAGSAGDAPPNSCAGKFLPMPASASAAHAPSYGAIVDAHFTGKDGTRVDGVPTYRTIGAALAQLPINGVGRVVIFVRNGRYREKLTVDRPYVTLRGESRDRTILTYDAAAGTPRPEGGTYGTRGSYTLRIVAPGFHAEHLTIENAFDYPANFAKAADDPTRVRDAQAVALMLDMLSDRAVFDDVRITGYQDTLFPNAGRSYFVHCEIAGNVDFIFGAGVAVFDDCDIISRDRGSATNNGYITAPSTPASQPYGFVFVHSRLKKERPSMAPASVTLGRPWHPYGAPGISSSAVFIDCWMDDHIGAKGWDRMSHVDSTGQRIWNEPEDARFFEYGSTGPGGVASPRRRVLSAAQAATYAVDRVLGGWVPLVTPASAR